MQLTKKLAACLTAALFVIAMTATVFAAEGSIDWNKGVIRATGIGAGKPAYQKKNPGIYRAQAKRAAIMDAQRNLAETVKGVRVTSESTMEEMILKSDVVRTRVDSIIRGMSEVGEPKYFEDGTCEITLEMPLFGGNNSLSEAAFIPFKDEPRVSFPTPVDVTIINQSTVINNNYTGLVIDCRGMNINCVMSPVIKNAAGTKIYGHQNLDYDKIIVNGMASYADAADDQISRARAGNNPLVVRAVALSDLNANPVVSVADADRILAANQHDRFLDNCAVVFVK